MRQEGEEDERQGGVRGEDERQGGVREQDERHEGGREDLVIGFLAFCSGCAAIYAEH